MKRNCQNCSHFSGLSSYGVCEVSCKRKGRIRVADPSGFAGKESDCDAFEPNMVRGQSGVTRAKYLDIIRDLRSSPIIGQSVREYAKVPSASQMRFGRGTAMIELSDDNLPSFEGDDEYKDYGGSNHRFADLLVPMSQEVRRPVVFWLAKKHSSGARYLFANQSIEHHVIQLGNPYQLEQVLYCLARALKAEGIVSINAWFVRDIERTTSKAITDMDPICEEVYLEMEPALRSRFVSSISELRPGKTNWFSCNREHIDLEALGRTLSLDNYIIARTDANKTVRFRRSSGDKEEEATFGEFIDEYLSPPRSWVLLHIESAHRGTQWVPILRHMNSSRFSSGGVIALIESNLALEDPFLPLGSNRASDLT